MFKPKRLFLMIILVLVIPVVGCGSTPTTQPLPKNKVDERWRDGSQVAQQLRSDLSEIWFVGLRPSAVGDYHRKAYEAYKKIPRDCGDKKLNTFLDLVTQSERDITEVYSQYGSDSKIQKLTPNKIALFGGKDTLLGVYFEIRDSDAATNEINKTVSEWREKLRKAEAETIEHLEKTHGERLTPW